ncbi:MAG: ammonium transporter [Anaerolineales bacterium]|nr:ammonium transporter [Anaerolineales bacterium]MCB0012473.1 ammonium transporter [Anaerolineales bacterium]
MAQEGPAVTDELAFAIDNMFLFIAAVLVLFMQAGFALVEAGFNSGKNTVNILFKNLMDLCLGAILYFIVGYGLMYGGPEGGFIGFGQFGIPAWDGTMGSGVLHPQVDFFFQVAFAATAATIVSGAVAGRMQFKSYLIYSAVITGIIYPISGFWKWGGGWLDALGFYDFAGSLIVHAVGGFAGLAGAIVLGPRIGRFNKDGSSNAMPGHNITAATLGVFILLVGWFGFNPGSQLLITSGADVAAVVLIATNTLLAACAGAVLAMILSVFVTGKPDLSYALNGMLAGLVGITANCDSVTNIESLAIGAIAGMLVVGGMVLLEKVRIDDPVGAWPVHGLCGIWGGIATGIFGGHPLGVQVLGSLVIPAWSFVTMFALFYGLKLAGILRVSEKEELEGLDVTEHGTVNYPEFVQPVTSID